MVSVLTSLRVDGEDKSFSQAQRIQRHQERAAETGAEQDTQAVARSAPDTKSETATAQVQSIAEDAAEETRICQNKRACWGITQQNRHRSLKWNIPHPRVL